LIGCGTNVDIRRKSDVSALFHQTLDGCQLDLRENAMTIEIREMAIDDYDDILSLWRNMDGVIVDDVDSRNAIALYLDRNKGLSFVALAEGSIVGTVLCGHDGRRGLLRHLAVKPEFRRQGIARKLIAKSLEGLSAQGISKCNAYVIEENKAGQEFWKNIGWNMLARNFKIMQSSTQNT
jgi:N-acetylglutamate synthase